LIICGLICRP